MSDRDKYRPPPEERMTNDRTEPVQIEVRTEWLYSDPRPDRTGEECICCPGRHAFSRSGKVVRSDVPPPYSTGHDLASHLHRAIGKFGDDADLVIEVRRKDDQ